MGGRDPDHLVGERIAVVLAVLADPRSKDRHDDRGTPLANAVGEA
jgi:hypothetical protein